MPESISVHETFQGMPLLELEPIVVDSKQTTRRGGTGTGTHVLQLRGSGLFSGKTPTPTERAYVRNVFDLWSRKIVVRRDDNTTYDGWIGRRRWDPEQGTLTLSTFEMRAAQFRVRLTYPVLRHLEGDLNIIARNAEGAARAIVERAMVWGGGFSLPIDLCADGAGTLTISWPWYQHLTIEDLLQQIEKTGCEIYFRPYRNDIGAARYQTVVAPKIVGNTFALPHSAAHAASTGLLDDEDGSGMLTGVEYQGNGFDKDAVYAGANYATLFPGGTGLAPIPNRDTIRNAKDVTDANVLASIALADLWRDYVPGATQSFDLQMNDTVTAAWGQIGTLLEAKQRADEWSDGEPAHHRVVGCTTTYGSNTLGLELERHG